jgi:hypothetical protein
VRYAEVHLVFADSRLFAEEWTYRFLSTAFADASAREELTPFNVHRGCLSIPERISIFDPYRVSTAA